MTDGKISMGDYSDLSGMSYEAKETVAPEDEFFHSLYIAGQTRKNHINVVEQAGKMQIRGVEYNQDTVYGIITHIKAILVKAVQKQGKESTECFSYCLGPAPWRSSTGKVCGKNSGERASIDFCKDCRAQIVVALMRTNPDGTIYTNQDKKPVFIFLRAKGVKYSNVSTYLNDLAKLDLEPVVDKVTEESTKWEKSTVNHKRFITKIGIGTVPTHFGNKSVFTMERSAEIPKSQVNSLLTASKKTINKFNEKFDWSKKGTSASVYGYGDAGSETKADDSFADIGAAKTESVKEEPKKPNYNFDEVDF